MVSLMGHFKGVTHLQSLAHRKRQRWDLGAIGLDGGAMNLIVIISVCLVAGVKALALEVARLGPSPSSPIFS